MKLYTVDVDPSVIELEKPLVYQTYREQKLKRIQDRMIRNNLREQALQGTKQMSSLFETNPEISAMIKPFTVEFRITYREAFQLFIDG